VAYHQAVKQLFHNNRRYLNMDWLLQGGHFRGLQKLTAPAHGISPARLGNEMANFPARNAATIPPIIAVGATTVVVFTQNIRFRLHHDQR